MKRSKLFIFFIIIISILSILSAICANAEDTDFKDDEGQELIINTDYPEHTHTGGTATCANPPICTVCGQYYGEKLSTHGMLEHHAELNSKCGTPGYKEHFECPICNSFFDISLKEIDKSSIEISYTPHVPGEESFYDDTCHYKICQNCGEKCEIVEHKFNKIKILNYPSGSIQGTIQYTCLDCDTTKVVKYDGKPTEHTHSMFKIEGIDPTCLESGRQTFYVCIYCGNYFLHRTDSEALPSKSLVTISPSGHAPGLPATLTEPQLCRTCGTVLVKALTPDIVSRSNTNWTSTSGPTSITFEAAIDDFIEILVNGQKLSIDDFSINSTKTVITFNNDYQSTLKSGNYNITIKLERGDINNYFIIKATDDTTSSTKSSSPKITKIILISIIIIFVGGLVVSAYLIYRKLTVINPYNFDPFDETSNDEVLEVKAEDEKQKSSIFYFFNKFKK